jgi:hypothetical protein
VLPTVAVRCPPGTGAAVAGPGRAVVPGPRIRAAGACHLEAEHHAGDHVVVGRVVHPNVDEAVRPLVCHGGS